MPRSGAFLGLPYGLCLGICAAAYNVAHLAWNDSRDVALLIFLLIAVPLGFYFAGLHAARREQANAAGVREGLLAGIVFWVVFSATNVGFSLIAPDIYARYIAGIERDYFGASGVAVFNSCLAAFLILPAAGIGALGGLGWRTYERLPPRRERVPSARRRFPRIALGALVGQVLFIPFVVTVLLVTDPKSAVFQASVWSAFLGLLIILIALSIAAAQAVRLIPKPPR
jgi:hypothetical protein